MDLMNLVKAFICGGLLCAIGQVLMDRTKLMTARIMVLFLLAGAILTALGIYEPIVEFAGAGATVPIIGFGYALAKGAIEEVAKEGFIGIFTGGLKATAAGITAAIVFGYVAALVSNPKSK